LCGCAVVPGVASACARCLEALGQLEWFHYAVNGFVFYGVLLKALVLVL
jgi:hypothetical protein